jgi:hypothetical protein
VLDQDDAELYDRMEAAALSLVECGMSRESAVYRVSVEFAHALGKAASSAASDLVSASGPMLAAEQETARRFQQTLDAIWGQAFDLFYMVGYGTAEFADRFLAEQGPPAATRSDDVFVALSRLHERGRRVLWEVHRLLTGGFPNGALARARTLHELAVVAIVIGEHGRKPDSRDLATRYLAHEAVGSLAQAESSNRALRNAGQPLLPASEIVAMRRRVRNLTARYGQSFALPNGWAVPLLPLVPAQPNRRARKVPSLADLERLADQSFMRSAYSWMSAEVHAGPDGLVLNADPFEDSDSMIGPTTVGLAEPGRLALTSMHHLTWAMVTGGVAGDDGYAVENLLSLKVIEALIKGYVDAGDLAESEAVTTANVRPQGSAE